MIFKFQIKQHPKSSRFFLQRTRVMDGEDVKRVDKMGNLTIDQLQKLKLILDKFLEEHTDV